MTDHLPKNWIETDVQTVVTYQKGKKPKVLKDEPFIGSVPYLDIKAFEKGVVRRYGDIESSNLIEQDSIGIVWDGARSGWVGIGKQGAVGSTIAILNPILVNSYYTYRFLQSKFDYLNTNTRGTGIPHVDPRVLWNIPFPLPPLQEQKRIVAKLDDLFNNLEEVKNRLDIIPKLLKDFRQAILTKAVTGNLTKDWRNDKQLFSYLPELQKNREHFYQERVSDAKSNGERKPKKLDVSPFEIYSYDSHYELPSHWELANLKNIADLITDGEHATPKRSDKGYYLLSARNVQNGWISLEKVDFIPKEEFLRIKKRCNPEHLDVLISCSGSVGRVSIVPDNLEFGMVRSAALLKLQSNTRSAKFIELCLRSDIGQKQIKSLQKATAQANLFLGPIGKIVIPIPSIEEQLKIVSIVESLFSKVHAIEEKYMDLKQKTDNLPQAILAKAFKGELLEQLPIEGDARDLLKEIEALKIKNKSKKRNKK